MGQNDDGWAALGRRLAQLRETGGLSQTNLAERIPYNRPKIVQAEGGTLVPIPEKLVTGADRVLCTGGELARMRETLTARQAGEVGPTDRRDAIRTMSLAPFAVALSRRIAGADPDPASIDEYEDLVLKVAGSYRTTPHDRLRDEIAPRWHDVEILLDDRVSPRVRAKLTLAAGQLAFYLGTAAFDLGDDAEARGLLRVADQHATEAGDLLPAGSPLRSDVQLLTGSVAAMMSSVAYYNGAYARAADIAAQARHDAHPYALPILAGCEARAAARAGRREGAEDALRAMRDNVWDGDVMPGPNPGTAAFAESFLAGTLTSLGEGELAEAHARTGLRLELASSPEHFVQIGGSHMVVAATLLERADPDPEQAAATTVQALTVIEGQPTRSIVQNAGRTLRQMSARWPDLPAVRELGELFIETRKALPSAV